MTKERSSSNTRRPIDTSLSNSFSSGVSSLSSSNYGVRTVRVFKNGDPYHQGTKFVVNRRYVHDLDHMLNLLSEKIDLPYGAKRLFTTNGKLVRHLNDIEDKQDYVASSNQFIPLKYGNTTTSIGHPFRSTSPINMITPQSRQSRSQTRGESRPAVMKRSQSGLTSASTAEKNAKPSTKSGQGTPSKKAADGKPKKKVVKKKKKTESEVIVPVANDKEETKEAKKEVKEEKKEEVKKEDEKKVEEKKTVEQKEEIVVPEDTPRTIERSPSPKKDDSPEKHDTSDEEHKEEKSRSPSPAAHSAGSATEHEDHSGSEKHSDGNETDAEKSPRPVRKPTPKPNGKEQPKSDKSSGESGSDKESEA